MVVRHPFVPMVSLQLSSQRYNILLMFSQNKLGFGENLESFGRSLGHYFDPYNMDITRVSIWVHLPNLPIHFWHFLVFQGILNFLDRFIATKLNEEMRESSHKLKYAQVFLIISIGDWEILFGPVSQIVVEFTTRQPPS